MGRKLHCKTYKWLVCLKSKKTGVKTLKLYCTIRDISEDIAELNANKIGYMLRGIEKHQKYRNAHIKEMIDKYTIIKLRDHKDLQTNLTCLVY